MIKRILATQRNCKMIVSYDVYLAKAISMPARASKIIKESRELNQNTHTPTSKTDKAYNIFSDCLPVSWSQILRSIFQKIALPIYHHMRTKLLHPPLVVASQLPLLFTCTS